jgi:sarcosine oxidase delta subunit
VPLLADLADFLHDHRPHGPLTADATEPAWNGYLLIVTCSCGVVFEQWDDARGC